MKRLKLPRYSYGPIVLRLLKEFTAHHRVAEEVIQNPSKEDTSTEALSKILDQMLWSMGTVKHNEMIDEVEEYKKGLPANHR